MVSQAWLRCGEVGTGGWSLTSERCTRECEKLEAKQERMQDTGSWSGSTETLGQETMAPHIHSFSHPINSYQASGMCPTLFPGLGTGGEQNFSSLTLRWDVEEEPSRNGIENVRTR